MTDSDDMTPVTGTSAFHVQVALDRVPLGYAWTGYVETPSISGAIG